MYISRQRHVLMASDFWKADRASALVDVWSSGSRRSRSMNRSVEDRTTVPDAVSGVVLVAALGAVSGDATVVVSG
jgi:hypothetical protein